MERADKRLVTFPSITLAPEAELRLTKLWTPDEDDAPQVARHFNQVGTLARSKLERLLELGLRDPRKTIRPPREFAVEQERRETVKAGRRFRARPRG